MYVASTTESHFSLELNPFQHIVEKANWKRIHFWLHRIKIAHFVDFINFMFQMDSSKPIGTCNSLFVAKCIAHSNDEPTKFNATHALNGPMHAHAIFMCFVYIQKW